MLKNYMYASLTDGGWGWLFGYYPDLYVGFARCYNDTLRSRRYAHSYAYWAPGLTIATVWKSNMGELHEKHVGTSKMIFDRIASPSASWHHGTAACEAPRR